MVAKCVWLVKAPFQTSLKFVAIGEEPDFWKRTLVSLQTSIPCSLFGFCSSIRTSIDRRPAGSDVVSIKASIFFSNNISVAAAAEKLSPYNEWSLALTTRCRDKYKIYYSRPECLAQYNTRAGDISARVAILNRSFFNVSSRHVQRRPSNFFLSAKQAK